MSTRFDALDQSSNHNHSPRGIDEEITNTSSFLITCPEDLAGWVIGKEHVCLDALFHDMKRHWGYYFRISRYDLENGGFHVMRIVFIMLLLYWYMHAYMHAYMHIFYLLI